MSSIAVALLARRAAHTGNQTTIERLASSLRSRSGFAVEVFNAADEDAKQGLVDWNVTHKGERRVLLGLHAYHVHPLLDALKFSGCEVPYVLVLGGTDVNEYLRPDYSDQNARQVVKRVLQEATAIVAFNRDMATRVQREALGMSDSKSIPSSSSSDVQLPPVVVIPQAVEPLEVALRAVNEDEKVAPEHFSIHAHAGLASDDAVLLLCASLRPVKDPLFLVPAFQAWRRAEKSRKRVRLVVMGAALDVEMETKLLALNREDGVTFVPPVSHPLLLRAMQQSVAVVNSSISEGMCASLLESMQCGTIVCAREIPGNAMVITHDRNGLLFDSPDRFLELVEVILNPEQEKEVQRITETALAYVNQEHGCEQEAQAYVDLITHIVA